MIWAKIFYNKHKYLPTWLMYRWKIAKCNNKAKATKAKMTEVMAINMKAAVGTGRKNSSNCPSLFEFSSEVLLFDAIDSRVELVPSHGLR